MKRKILSILISILALCMCIFTFTACEKKEPSHTHEYSTLKYDALSHWHECSCGDKKDIENHKGGIATETNKAVCSVCEQEYGESLGHEHTHEYSILKHDAENHWYECSCGAYETKENHKGGTATETNKAVCSVCSQEYGESLGHLHTLHLTRVEAKPQSCTEEGNIEYYTCSCDKWFTNNTATVEITNKASVVIAKDDHEYKELKKSTTEHWHECSCGAFETKENHKGGTVTCKVKATCSVCETVYGNFAEHNPKQDWVKTETHHYHECDFGCTEKLSHSEHDFDSNKKCTVCDYVTTALLGTEISSDVYEINGTNLFVKIPNAQTDFSFANTINIAKGASYKVYMHSSCQERYNIPSYMVNNLNEGDHTYYLLVSNGTEIPQVYTVTVRRRPMHKVYLSSGTYQTVSNRLIEEDQYVTNLPIITRTGYDFAGWDYNGEPITKTTYIDALWTVKEDWSNFNFTVEWDSTNYCEKVTINGVKDKNITEIIIPEEITNISNSAFINCKNVTKINFNAIQCSDLKPFNSVFENVGYDTLGISLCIGNKVKKIPAFLFCSEYDFDCNINIKEIVFAENSSCETIGMWAFAYLEDIFEVAIPDSVINIEIAAFYSAKQLKSVSLGQNIAELEAQVFFGCILLESVNIPSSVRKIGKECFRDCTMLSNVVTEDVIDGYYWHAYDEIAEKEITILSVNLSEYWLVKNYSYMYWRYYR